VTRASRSEAKKTVGCIFGLTIALILSLGLTTALAAPPPAAQSAKAVAEIGTVQQVYNGTLYPDIQVRTFRNTDRLFPTRTVKRGAYVYPLPQSDVPLRGVSFTSAGKKYDMYDYMSLNRVAGLLILKDGKIVFERYELGNTESTRWMSMSMVKGIVSTLVAAAIKDGYIKSIDDPVTQYLPELAGSAYEGAAVRNLLQMASGVRWDETYTDPASDRRRMLDAQLAGNHAKIIEIMKTLPRVGQPGTIYNYSAADTQIISELIHAAVKKPLAQYLSERIWTKFGMESDALWWIDSPNGQEIGGSGFIATLRDYGRFAQFVMNGGVAKEEKIVPDWWFAEAGSSKVIGGKTPGYGYFWYIPNTSANPVHEGAFLGRGIFGQRMYINPKEKVVVVVLSAQPKPSGANTINDEDFIAAVVKALH
jgi:CubicO group peptidase (beta-lactamase class C family)